MNAENSYININNREEIEIKGISDVISYDSDKIVFKMHDCELILTGNSFNIKKLDVENMCSTVKGYLDSVVFSNSSASKQRSLLRGLFK